MTVEWEEPYNIDYVNTQAYFHLEQHLVRHNIIYSHVKYAKGRPLLWA